jgi:hypothetical protein
MGRECSMYARDGKLKSRESERKITCKTSLYLRNVKIINKEGDSIDWIKMSRNGIQ